MQKLYSDEQILDIGFRKIVIEEIVGAENVARKNASLRAYEIYKDMTKKWVVEALSREFSKKTLVQMVNRASNISILKKVVNKLAQAYVSGVTREGQSKKDTEVIQALAEKLKINHTMKKADRFLHLFRNTLIQVVPELHSEDMTYNIVLKVLPPHLFDVIPDAINTEKAKVLILTDFVERNQLAAQDYLGADGRAKGVSVDLHQGDHKEQVIANSPDDKGTEYREFIWWSPKYHFTTDVEGRIVEEKTPKDLLNPIGAIPGVFLHDDQDGSFWAQGGNDLVDGAIMLNVELTDLYTIKNVQGWGQPILSGKIREKEIVGGPHNALLLDYEEGDPEMKFYYATSNPPLSEHMKSIEMTAALYLSTNNLSPSNVAGKLDAASFPSGIAKMVEDAQSTEPVEDKQRYYKDKEPEVWNLIRLWCEAFADSLSPEIKEIGKISDPSITLTFSKNKQVITEKERLENLKLRKELGIDTMLELIKRDNPDLTDEQAEKKLLKITEENLGRQRQAMASMEAIAKETKEENATVEKDSEEE